MELNDKRISAVQQRIESQAPGRVHPNDLTVAMLAEISMKLDRIASSVERMEVRQYTERQPDIEPVVTASNERSTWFAKLFQ